ncbi:MAG: DEAD/DEAH box helicase [Lachnospiraceae bacterium]|nr:DEAD/DEAH box helicase [Lachnospiraceae bacterium]
MDIDKMVVFSRRMPAKTAEYEEYPAALLPELAEYLRARGIERLYSHQAQMFELALRGENVVITTSTASGKTLGFLLPVLQEILRNPGARALFIYPTKALASDQYKALRPALEYFGEDRVSAGVYDGDTTSAQRSRIRRRANIILTNPEMINSSFLPNHSKYGFDLLFANLQYVVIDELHTYRGAFGSHLANVMRRLGRVCRYYHSRPRFLCSSATIANPLELARGICGGPFEQVERDGAPRAERKYVFLQPPKIEDQYGRELGQASAAQVAAHLLPELMEKETSFIAFASSRRNVEIVLKETRDLLEGLDITGQMTGREGRKMRALRPEDLMVNRIAGYRGGYTPRERREIESRMNQGELLGLVATNALELGIDIGRLDATVLVGYPDTKASFWQQTGRAGRSGRCCTNYLILREMPFDRYIAVNPDWLFEGSSESAVIDPDNLLIQLAHIRAAAAEIPLGQQDMELFPDLGEAIPVLLEAGELTRQGGLFVWCGQGFPEGDYSLRNIDNGRYKLMNRDTGEQITEMDELQAYREIHEGAVYMHGGAQYQVTHMDMETRTSYAVPFLGNYYTVPGGNTEIRRLRVRQTCSYMREAIPDSGGRLRRQAPEEGARRPWQRQASEKEQEQTDLRWEAPAQLGAQEAEICVGFGELHVEDVVSMYKKLQFHNHQNLGNDQLPHPLVKRYDTEGAWIELPREVVREYRSMLREGTGGKQVFDNHFEGLCYALENAARMLTMTEKEDIGVIPSGNATGQQEDAEDRVLVYFYDKYTGGLGYAEKAYERMPEIVSRAETLVAGCACERGCIACIGDYRLNKSKILWGLERLRCSDFARAESGEDSTAREKLRQRLDSVRRGFGEGRPQGGT